MANQHLGYNPNDTDSIMDYAYKLRGKTLRQVLELDGIQDPHQRRGSFGSAIEQYFGIEPNSRPEADFDGVGLELKATPVKRTARGVISAKERLVFTMINFMTVVDEDFEHSQFFKKSANVLLITYLYEPGKDPIDYQIQSVARWGLPEEDLPQIKSDWETVVNKVRAGRAEEISGSDTLYLEACTKAKDSTVRTAQPFSSVPAKPRAWALKSSYMTAIQRGLIEKAQQIPRTAEERELSLLALLNKRFAPYVGMTENELAQRFQITGSKDKCARITQRILGLTEGEKIAEFEKAGIKPKTVRLKRSGRPKEAMSFPAFDYFELAERPFEASDFLSYLLQKYLFVLYQEDDEGVYRLQSIMLWQMPEDDLDEARRCYEQMQENVRNGRADVSVRSTENRCCHVRPHGRDSRDTRPQPYGPPEVKKCFWLNQGYLQEEIGRVLGG